MSIYAWHVCYLRFLRIWRVVMISKGYCAL